MNFITIPVGSFAANCYGYPLQSAGGDPAADGGGTLCAVIDPGADAKRIIAEIDARRWTPSLFLLTHGHFDHVAALGELYRHYRGYYCNTSKKNGTGQERGETAEALPTLPIVAIHSGDAQYIGACAADAHRQSIARAIGSASLDLERELRLVWRAASRSLVNTRRQRANRSLHRTPLTRTHTGLRRFF